MKKSLSLSFLVLCLVLSLCSCSVFSGEETSSQNSSVENKITVVSYDDGVGIRGIAAELFGFAKTEGDKIVDEIFNGATIKKSTTEIVSEVENNKNAVALVPFSAVKGDKVKKLSVNGVSPEIANIKSGSYKYSHNLYATTKGKADGGAQDFINFILSEDGQAIILEKGYISKSNTGKFTSQKPEGKTQIYVTDSLKEITETLKETYGKLNNKLNIEITVMNDKSALGELKDNKNLAIITKKLTEAEKESYSENLFGQEGIAVIVNAQNSMTDIKSEKVKSIFKGETENW